MKVTLAIRIVALGTFGLLLLGAALLLLQPLDQRVRPSDIATRTDISHTKAITIADFGPRVETNCNSKDMSVEKKIAMNLFQHALASSTLSWQLVLSMGTTSPDAMATLLGEGWSTDLFPCQYLLSYQMGDMSSSTFQRSLSVLNHITSTLNSSSTWHSDPYQKFVSDNTGASTTVVLNAAGGPGGDVSIYSEPLYTEDAVRFLGVTEQFGYAHGMEADDRCPCSETVSVGVSVPVYPFEVVRRGQ